MRGRVRNAGDPLVSVIMAVYDGAAFITEAIASVLAQTHERLDLIVVDDGSRDATVAIVREWMRRDRRVRLIERPHQGHAQSLNAGIAVADGALIARIDHDDRWHRSRLAVQIAAMEREGLDVCGSWVRRFGSASGVIRFPQSHPAILYQTLFSCPILDSASLFRGEVLRAHPYPPAAVVRQELTQLVRLLPRFRFANLPRYLCDYRAHPRQKTARFASLIRHRHQALCREHFTSLFPDASAADVATYQSVLTARAAPLDRDGLAAAGHLFTRYLKPEHPEARLRMQRRWRYLCGHGCRPGIDNSDIRNDILAQLC